MEEANKGLTIRIDVNSWMFLLVPAHMGSSRQTAL